MKFILRNIGGSLINPIDTYPNGVYNENTLQGYRKREETSCRIKKYADAVKK